MLARHVREAVLLYTVVMVAAACGGGSSEPSGSTGPSAVDIVSGNGQVQLVGTPLSTPLVVRVTSNGTPAKGATVAFAVATGAATVSPTSAVTDATGQAKAQVTLGSSPGEVSITASVAGTSLKATFSATAGASTITAACDAGPAATPTAGEVRTGVSGTGICLAGGASGAEYALVAFHANTDSSAVASVGVTARGAAPVVLASQAPAFDETLIGGALKSRVNNVQAAFDRRMRESARRDLRSKIPGAQAWYRRQPSFTAIPANPAIGSLVTLNANGLDNCSNPINVIARVAAVSTTAIVVADTANPTGGFTDAEYLSFATTFDTLISPLDIQNFGQPTDIDKNGKTIIFFTKEVNKLTPRGSAGVIGGFFFERDLFPTADTQQLFGCASSNFAEMYYSLVPDPTAKFSDARSKKGVQDLTPSTLAHEFQHLINAGRRLYVNNANDFEDQWLNEGLSHIAEELLYFRVAHLSPRQNIDVTTIRSNAPTSIDQFNSYAGDNFGRFELFLGKTSQISAYAGNDSLETRGATWSLLRYLADHRGTSDGDTWMRLVNSTTEGQHNLANVFGTNYLTQIRDWTTSIFADDVPGVSDLRFLAPSWNMRNIFPSLVNSAGTPLGIYPLKVIPISNATAGNASIFGGAAAYFRFSVPANTSASIDWSSSGLPVSPLVQFTVVRSK
jgi:hypothetical protein